MANLEDHPLVNLSRSSNQTYFDSNGLLQTAPANSLPPSYEYNSSTGLWEKKGWYIGEERKNLILDSRDLTTGNWDITGISISRDAVGLDNTSNTAITLTNTTTNTDRADQTISVADDNSTYIYTVFFKKNMSPYVRIRMDLSGGTGLFRFVEMDTNDGSISVIEGSSEDASVKDYGDWWRLRLKITNNNTGNQTLIARIYPRYEGVVDQTIEDQIIDQVQLEQASFPSPPIITGGSTVTRSATLADITDLSWYNQDEGTFVVEVESPASDTAWIASMIENNSNYLSYLIGGGNNRFQVGVGGISVAKLNDGFSINTLHNTACSYAIDDFALVSDGGDVQTDNTGGLPNPTKLKIGSFFVTQEFNGYIKSLKYYPKRLSNSQLQSLTS